MSALKLISPKSLGLTVILVLAACGGGGDGSSRTGPGPVGNTPPAPAPIVTLSASTDNIVQGESVTLSWQSQNADSCTASGGCQGSRAISGSESVGPLDSDQNFRLSCSGSAGSSGVMQEVSVNVSPTNTVMVDLDVDRALIRDGEQVTLTWQTDNADSCVAEGSWSGGQAVSGTFLTLPISGASTFGLRCEGNGQTGVHTLTVRVADLLIAWQAPSQNVDGKPLTTLAGYRVHWGATTRNYTSSETQAPGVTEFSLADFPAGDYRVAVTAFDGANDESEFSAEIIKIAP